MNLMCFCICMRVCVSSRMCLNVCVRACVCAHARARVYLTWIYLHCFYWNIFHISRKEFIVLIQGQVIKRNSKQKKNGFKHLLIYVYMCNFKTYLFIDRHVCLSLFMIVHFSLVFNIICLFTTFLDFYSFLHILFGFINFHKIDTMVLKT